MSEVLEDMSVEVTVTVSGTYDLSSNPTITATYSGTSTPTPKANQSVVQSNGNINLNALNKGNNSDYSNETNISFTLAGSIMDTEGNTYTPQFSADAGNNIHVVPVGSNPSNPGPMPSGWTRTANGSHTTSIVDPDTDSRNYAYALFAQFGTVTCQLDPSIMNRGTT